MYRIATSRSLASAPRSVRFLALAMALLMVVGSFGAVQPRPAIAQTTVFQVGNVTDNDASADFNAYLTYPFEIEEVPGGPPAQDLQINASMTATISNLVIYDGGTTNGGLIGGDAMEFDVTITNSASSNAILTAWAFQSKFSESPALGSRIGDKAFYATLESGGVAGQMASVKKNGTSNGLFSGKWKGICINSSLDFIPEFNSGLEDESLECAGNRADEDADGEPELQTGDDILGLRPGESQTVRIRIEAGTTDGALHVVQPGTLQGRVIGTPQTGPNGLTYFVPSIDSSFSGSNVLAIPDFGDNKVLRNADGTFNPTFAPAADGYTFQNQQYLTLPRRNFAFSDLLGRNHSCGTYGLDLVAGIPCTGNPAAQPFIRLDGTGDLVPGVPNLVAILQGYGEFYDPNNDFVPDPNPNGEFPGDTRPSFPYDVLCENCGGTPYVPIAEFYLDTGTVDTNGQPVLVRQITGGSFGTPGTAGQYTATISTATAEDVKEELIPEPDPGGPCEAAGRKPACAQLGTSATGVFHSLSVVSGQGINGGDAVEFTIDITNNSSNPDAYLTAFNYTTKRRSLADIGPLDGFTQDRRDIRVDSTLPPCGSLDDSGCYNAGLGIGHFPNVIGNGLLFGQMVWTNADAGREPDAVDSDQVFVSPSGINPTPYRLESVKKNGPFSPILKGNTNFICVKSGLFLLDPDADAACAGEPATLIDPDEPPIPSNIDTSDPANPSGRLGLRPGETQSVRIRMEFGDFRGALLQIVAGTLTSANVDPRYGPSGTNTNGLARFFDCSDQRELEWCHPHLVGETIGYLPNTIGNPEAATWLTPATLDEIEYVIINQPGEAPTLMNFQQNFGYILAMAGFVPSAEFYAPDPNPELVGTPYEGVLIRQQVLGTWDTPPLPASIASVAPTTATVGTAYTYDVNAFGFPTPTYSLDTAPSGMTINSTSGVISWTPPASGAYNVVVRASNSAASVTQAFTINVAPPPILDNFNRANGALKNKWVGDVSQIWYRIKNQQVEVLLGGLALWNESFNKNQEASFTFTKYDTRSRYHGLVLKAQTKHQLTPMIVVFYDAVSKKIVVQSKDRKWAELRTVGSFNVGALPNGTAVRAQALDDGKVYVYITRPSMAEEFLGSADAGAFFRTRGGYTGFLFLAAPRAGLDDFNARNVGR
ncbi:MAG: hypothetical protein OHK0015_19600 [Chloroflexi bacterium OHK40]